MTKLVLLSHVLAAVAMAQQPVSQNRYEAVSIKPGDRGATRYGYHPSPGEIRLDNISIPELMSSAWRTTADRLIGLPVWALSERFSLRAKSAAPANPGEQWAMWVQILESRFMLKYHRETRPAPVYELSVLPAGVKFPVTVPGTCTPIGPNDSPTPVVDPKKPDEKRPPIACGMSFAKQLPAAGVELTIRGATMAQLSNALRHYMKLPVIDRTGTTQMFDVQLGFVNPLAAVDENTHTEFPAIDSALKRAGLNLTRASGNVEFIVIDRLERPSEN